MLIDFTEMMKLQYDSIFEKIWLLLHIEYDVYTKNRAKKLVIEILDNVYHKGYQDGLNEKIKGV
jgi:hypothetical protein